MRIKSVIGYFIIPLVIISCGENNSNSPKSSTKIEPEITYYQHGDAFISGQAVNLWSEIPKEESISPEGTPEQEVKKPLLTINASEPIKVIVLGIEGAKLLTILDYRKKGWLKIRYGSDEALKEGFVEHLNVYSDEGLNILYATTAVSDAGERIKITPKNYSTSSQLNLGKQYSEMDSHNELSNQTCDLYDAAIIINSIEDLKRGEFETKDEFSERKNARRKLAFSTGVKEKIYAFSAQLPVKNFDYDVDTETLSIELLKFEVENSCGTGLYSSSCDNKNEGNISAVRFVTSGRIDGFDCPVNTSEGINFQLRHKKPRLGQFNIEASIDGNYSSSKLEFTIIEKLKFDRNVARNLKESGLSYKYLIGLSTNGNIDGNDFEGDQWSLESCYGDYPNRNCYNSPRGRFRFSSRIEYLILFDEKGNVIKSYSTGNYINNYLQNDLLIQKHAHPNKSILEGLDSLEEKEQLAKLFFNRLKENIIDK